MVDPNRKTAAADPGKPATESPKAPPPPGPARTGVALEPRGAFPRWVLLALGALLTAGVIATLAGDMTSRVLDALTQGVFALAVLVPAWMLGIPLTRRLARRGCFEESPWPAGFRSLVALALGLGVFALATLLAGTLRLVEPGGSAWPLALLPAAGVVAGLVPARNFIVTRTPGRPSWLAQKAHRGDWLLLPAAIPAAVLLIAASFPPGSLWRSEGLGYDVMEYHLQLPREYALANSTAPLAHNVYSYLPANVEMLYLLVMQIAKTVMGNEREIGYLWGTYPAQFLHAMLVSLTAGAIALVPLGPRDRSFLHSTGRAVAVLLFLGVPWTLITGSLAYNEAGMMFFGTLALGLALGWHSTSDIRANALLIGVLLGLAMGCKLTAALFFAGPAAIVFLARSMTNGAHLKGLAIAVALAGILYAPWAIRAAAFSGGNPVFPLGTSVLPRGGWTAGQAQRFDRGHRPREDQQTLSARLKALADQALLDGQWSVQPYALVHIADDPPVVLDTPWERLGLLWLALPLAILCALLPTAGATGRGETLMLLVILVVQVAAWLFTTHLQGRFLLPATIPLALLAGRGVQGLRLATEGLAVAALRIVTGTMVTLHALATGLLLLPSAHLLGGVVTLKSRPDWWPRPEPPIGEVFSQVLNLAAAADPENPDVPVGVVLLVGEAKVWKFIGDVRYATVFDTQPLAEHLRGQDPARTLAWLQDEGVEYLFVNWSEIKRLRDTYGFDAAITPEAIAGLSAVGIEDLRLADLPPTTALLAVPARR